MVHLCSRHWKGQAGRVIPGEVSVELGVVFVPVIIICIFVRIGVPLKHLSTDHLTEYSGSPLRSYSHTSVAVLLTWK